ncbi:aminopeptidase N [Marinicella rhabdoformis]|uniref:aminopeptidase N n=1 Tax=Marinicella rhabdoformis TaxID=2580566 RepID=UPI0012AEC7D7|nr:aminopeptidase N [Marinicella rhabdoformis]
MTITKTTHYRKDYQQPNYWIENVDLAFLIAPDHTLVKSRINFKIRSGADNKLSLNGIDLELNSIKLNDKVLNNDEYSVDDTHLHLFDLPDNFLLQTEVKIYPHKNTALEGLYQSGAFFLTQCEAEGFRKITYYLDRPDVLAPFTVTIVADRNKYPVLLSNGNALLEGQLSGGKHYAKWQDPHPKPSYLFALVAGDLAFVEDHYRTMEGRDVQLRVYTEAANIDACDFAMKSLINSMQWDETRFGLAYDLDQYNIVATDDFNMGAMENKGLNIFNSKYVLAKSDTATDHDFIGVEAVIGHEYFHNWTGNRVTCKDWFQLSLKEGLTVFRDQEFTSDLQSRAVKRIEDVRYLRSAQFAEDAGPMSHSVRPDSFIEINNFYTLTVYEKGSEVVRMYHTLLGEVGFQKGMKLYFERHDGMAVSCNDFRLAMADANNIDLSQFELWYSQNGTPVVAVDYQFDEQKAQFIITTKQSAPASFQGESWQPMHIPMKTALFGKDGLPLSLNKRGDTQIVLEITEATQQFVFDNISTLPVVSLFRGFSAPVKVKQEIDTKDLSFLMKFDNDDFNRWDASQLMQREVIMSRYQAVQNGVEYTFPDYLLDAFRHVLLDDGSDPALVAEAITLPALKGLMVDMEGVDVAQLHQAKEWVVSHLVNALQLEFLSVYNQNFQDGPYQVTPEQVARRSLKNRCLWFLMHTDQKEMQQLCFEQYHQSNNYTDKITALTLLVHHQVDGHEQLLADYYDNWKYNALMINKWLSIQATVPHDGVLENIESLMNHECFSMKNPNAVRSLIGAFCAANITQFHAEDGSGYQFLADNVMALDELNPQVAARMVSLFNDYKQFKPDTQMAMLTALKGIHTKANLSANVYEIVEKALKN